MPDPTGLELVVPERPLEYIAPDRGALITRKARFAAVRAAAGVIARRMRDTALEGHAGALEAIVARRSSMVALATEARSCWMLAWDAGQDNLAIALDHLDHAAREASSRGMNAHSACANSLRMISAALARKGSGPSADASLVAASDTSPGSSPAIHMPAHVIDVATERLLNFEREYAAKRVAEDAWFKALQGVQSGTATTGELEQTRIALSKAQALSFTAAEGCVWMLRHILDGCAR